MIACVNVMAVDLLPNCLCSMTKPLLLKSSNWIHRAIPVQMGGTLKATRALKRDCEPDHDFYA
jgi:hypothetical protein